MKMPIRKVLILVLALTLVCGLAVTGLAATIGYGAVYHEYILVDHYLSLTEHRASASVTIEDTYGGIDMSNTGTITLRYSYYDADNRIVSSYSRQTSRLYETGASVVATTGSNAGSYMTSATGSYNLRLDICGTVYRHQPRDLTLYEENYR